MTNNDVLRGIRYLMNIPDQRLIEIAALAGCKISPADVAAYLKDEGQAGFSPCPHEVMAYFLDGLIVYKRGRRPEDEGMPARPLEIPVTNNIVLKKLRVAFELKDTDLVALIEKPGAIRISKAELGAFFRAPGHRNYRECGDQVLRNLLKAMSV